MARLISDFLGAREPDFTYELRRIESLAGRPKEDIRLIGDLARLLKELATELELDKHDTTAQELFFALRKEVIEHNEKLARDLGVKPSDSPQSVIKKCIKYVNDELANRPVWTIKNSVLKEQLKTNQPKKTLKILGLRSIDSALKREPISQILYLAERIESKTWLETYAKQANKLRNIDFDKKTVDISIMDETRRSNLEKAGYELREVVYAHPESGGIFVLPPKGRFKVDVIFYIDALLRRASEIRKNSSFTKYLSVRSDFSNILTSMRLHGMDEAGILHFNFGWSPMHLMLHKKIDPSEPAMFEPYLDHEDVHIDRYEPAKIWRYRYLITDRDGVVVSTNISDVILNTANEASIEKSSYAHGRKELYSELFSRYLEHDPVLRQMTSDQS